MVKFLESFWRICYLEMHNISVVELIAGILAVALFVHIFVVIYVRVKGEPISFSTEVLIILLISYIVFIGETTILSRAAGSQKRVFDTKHLWIDAKMDQNMTNLLNIVLFIPYGALLTAIRDKRTLVNRVIMTIVYCFLTSMFVECVQYVTARGYFEVDDLEANVLGGLIGSMFVCICNLISRKWEAGKGIKSEDSL